MIMLKNIKIFNISRQPMREFIPAELPLDIPISEAVYKLLITASRALSELRGIARTIPNRYILINALSLQEAKDSSEIENIITTHDELFLANISKSKITQATKEVQDYSKALQIGFWLIRKDKLFRNSHILAIQKNLKVKMWVLDNKVEQCLKILLPMR